MRLLNLYGKPEKFDTEFGQFDIQFFFNGLNEAVVLSYGKPEQDFENVLVRIQTQCVHHQLYRKNHCNCDLQTANSLELIRKNQSGILILLESTTERRFVAQFFDRHEDTRDYSFAIQILKEYFKIKSIKLISINRRKITQIEKEINIAETIWDGGNYIKFNPLLDNIIDRIASMELISPFDSLSKKKKKVLCIGDINIDFDMITQKHDVRGSAFNSWQAFSIDSDIEKDTIQYYPILFGKIGNDANGKKVDYEIKSITRKSPDMYAMIGVSEEKPTCEVKIFPAEEETHFHYKYDLNNANDYDPYNLKNTLKLINLKENDLIHIASYILVQYKYNISECKEFFKLFRETNAKIIVDIARYTVKKRPRNFDISNFGEILNESGGLFLLISDINSIKLLLSNESKSATLNTDQINEVFNEINTSYFIYRRGDDDIRYQDIYVRDEDSHRLFHSTEYPYDNYHNTHDKRGFGDILTIQALQTIFSKTEISNSVS